MRWPSRAWRRRSTGARACVEAGADMIFPEAITELAMYRQFADAVEVPVLANITEFGADAAVHASTSSPSAGVGDRALSRCRRSAR